VLDIRYLTSKTGPYDVRWEKVERINLSLCSKATRLGPWKTAAAAARYLAGVVAKLTEGKWTLKRGHPGFRS
jgi:hypothetical protein